MADRNKTSALLQKTRHRPYPLPSRKWVYYQEWKDVLFLHWKADTNLLRALVPLPLEIDTLNDDAWLSVVLFSGEKFHPRYAFPIPAISNFLQVNIRTYVNYQNRPGIYFLSISTNKIGSSFLSRLITHLPYTTAQISHDPHAFSMENDKDGCSLGIRYKETWRIVSKSAGDRWLTDRYCVYHVTNGQAFRHEVHHSDWALHNVNIQKMDFRTTAELRAINRLPDLSHFSYGFPVLAWKRVKT
jgi:uncharacterized protein